MQAPTLWSPPGGTLGGIVAEAFRRAEALRARERELEQGARSAPRPPSLAAALRRADVAVVAEVKRRSPSKGEINGGLDAVAQARRYVEGGAAAISVLTEPAHFGGTPEDLRAVAAGVAIPVLRKDFHVSELQLLEARALGAAAVLLIARALPPDRLAELARFAGGAGLDVLVEVRDEPELERALEIPGAVIGVNNRNLESLVIDPGTSERLVPRIPGDRVAIAESGVAGRADVERAARAGADAVLVGSVVSAAPDPAAAVRALTGVKRHERA